MDLAQRKQTIVEHYLLYNLAQINPNISNMIRIGGASAQNTQYCAQKLEYMWNAIQDTLLHGQSGSFFENLYRLVEMQNERIAYLEEKLSQISMEKQSVTDLEKITSFLNIIFPTVSKPAALPVQDNASRLPIAVFTPLSPLKNGIAHYTEDVLVELCAYFDIELFVDEGYKPDNPAIIKTFPIYSHREYPQRRANYKMTLYQVGNNPDHVYMVPYILQYPGVMVQHDFSLSYLRSFLSDKLKAYCDTHCDSLVHQGNEDGKNPFNKYLFDKCKGVIVHSDYVRLGILEQNADVMIRKIEHYSKIPADTEKREELCHKAGFSPRELLVASFGFVTVTKRTKTCLRVFSRVIRDNPGIPMRLLIVGKMDEDCEHELLPMIRQMGLQNQVTITGYVQIQELKEYMLMSDICFNLRYPYGGETSGTLARLFGMGKACIVTDIGAFGEFPDDICVKIPCDPVSEEENAYQALCALVRSKTQREEMGARAKSYVEKYLNIKQCVSAYRDFIYETICEKNIVLPSEILHKTATFLAYNRFDSLEGTFSVAAELLAERLF